MSRLIAAVALAGAMMATAAATGTAPASARTTASAAAAATSASKPTVGKAPLKDLIGQPVKHVKPPAATQFLGRPTGGKTPCPAPKPGQAQCASASPSAPANGAKASAARATTANAKPKSASAAAAATVSGYSPAQLQSAYNVTASSLSEGISGGAPETVAVVSAYDDPNAATDLAAYRTQEGQIPCIGTSDLASQYSLPLGSGCVTKVNENNQTSPLPSAPTTAQGDWTGVASEQIDMISAMCPNCQILLVEGSNNSVADLGQGTVTAENDADFITSNWYTPEFSGEAADDQAYFNAPGKALVFPSGNSGYKSEWPASSQYVTSVGGTTLKADTSASRGWDETAYSSGGSACATLEAKPSWQPDTASADCHNRTENDVAADADPTTGVAAYDSTAYTGTTARTAGWTVASGTTTAAGIITGIYALNGLPQAGTYPASYPYQSGSSGDFNDVTSGSNGTCESTRQYLCNAASGYDAETGAGTPNGAAGLAFHGSGSVVSVPDPGVKDYAWGDQAKIPIQAVSSDPSAAITYSATGLPNGLSINSATGTITGTIPDTSGTSAVTVTATDSDGGSGSTTFNIVSVRTMGGGYNAISGHVTVALGGLCMNDANAATAAGSPIETYTCESAGTENWTFKPSAHPGGAGALALSSNTSLCLTATGTAVDAKTVLDSCDGGRDQQWSVQDGPQLLNPVSGRCLTVPGNSTANNTQLVIGNCAAATSQQWTLPASGIQSGVDSRCLDDYQDATANNTKVDIYTCNGAVSQQWTLGADKTLRVQGVCLDMTKNWTLDGGLAEIYACTSGAANQQWTIGPQGQIINVNSGKCLDDPGDTSTLGVQIQQQDCYGQAGELWQST